MLVGRHSRRNPIELAFYPSPIVESIRIVPSTRVPCSADFLLRTSIRARGGGGRKVYTYNLKRLFADITTNVILGYVQPNFE